MTSSKSTTNRPAKEPAHDLTKRTCGNCAHWYMRDPGLGECRRHAPKPFNVNYVQNNTLRVLWPAVDVAERACGEFMPLEFNAE